MPGYLAEEFYVGIVTTPGGGMRYLSDGAFYGEATFEGPCRVWGWLYGKQALLRRQCEKERAFVCEFSCGDLASYPLYSSAAILLDFRYFRTFSTSFVPSRAERLRPPVQRHAEYPGWGGDEELFRRRRRLSPAQSDAAKGGEHERFYLFTTYV